MDYALEGSKAPDTYGFRGFRPKTVGQKLPPFGRRLMALRRAGRIPDTKQIVVAIADWTLVNRDREDAVVIPYGEKVADFDFRFCAGLPVVMVVGEHDIGIADEVAQQVITAGSRGCVCLIKPAFTGKTGLKVYQSHFGVHRVGRSQS